MARIFKLSEKALESNMDWDQAINENEIVTVKEFDGLDDAVKEFETEGYIEELYGVTSL